MSDTPQPSETDAPLILGVSGLRGIVGQSLTPEIAVRYAAAFGAWLLRRDNFSGTVYVASDGRQGGQWVYHSAVLGLLTSGADVHGIGVAMTPTAGFAMREGDAAVVVTASHNPSEWNGLKCLVSDSGLNAASGRAPSKAEADEIIAFFEQLPAPNSSVIRMLNLHSNPLAAEDHAQHCASLVRVDLEHARNRTGAKKALIVLDSVNCSGSHGALHLAHALGIEATQLFGDGSGIFPHTPEPTKENLSGEGGLCDAVPRLKADIGFAQDPDADRLAIVDEKGEYIGEEYTLVLCAMALLEARGGAGPVADAPGSKNQKTGPVAGAPGSTNQNAGPVAGAPGSLKEGDQRPVLVTNLSTSRMIDDLAAHYGTTVERTPVGEANVVQRMKQLAEEGRDVVLAGEGNGGVIWPEVVYVRDSLSAMALTLALMARTGKTVSQLVRQIDSLSPGGHGYTIVKRKVGIPSKAAADPAVEAVRAWAGGVAGARVDLQDGVRVDFDQGDWVGSWVHIRASNTEPIMRLICEAPSEQTAIEILKAVENAIAD